jgi:hypothetical protein
MEDVMLANDTNDTELLRLGRELDKVERQWVEMTRADMEHKSDPRDESSWPAYENRVAPLFSQILEMRAKTIEGFAIQVRAAVLALIPHLGESGAERNELSFLEAAAHFAGIKQLAPWQVEGFRRLYVDEN